MKLNLYFIGITFTCLLTACKNDTATSKTEVEVIDSIATTIPSQTNITSTEKKAFDIVPEGIYRSLNEKLAASNKKISPTDIMQMYYPAKISNKASFEKIDLQTEQKEAQTIVTLTHDNQSEHIRIQGHRIIMTLEATSKTQWKILSIQQQFKCWIRKDGALWSNDKCS